MNIQQLSKIFSLSGLFLAACVAEVGDEELALSSKHQEIQRTWITYPGYVGQAAISTATETTSSLGKSVGNLVPYDFTWKDGSEGNCGATFISPHYAVTAAHCLANWAIGTVAGGAPDTSYQFRIRHVELINTTGTPFQNAVRAQSAVRYKAGYPAVWPNWERATTMPAAHYTTTSTPCRLARRCGNYGQNYQCPNVIKHGVNMSTADIALVYCPNRSASANFATVEPTDLESTVGVNQNIEIRWFHEVLDLDTPTIAGGTIAFNYQHYSDVSSNWQNNFHYNSPVDAPTQYFPLITRYSGRNGEIGYPLEARGRMTATLTSMDAAVCHGTSGSGVFLMPGGGIAPRLLGPVVRPGGWSAEGKLCDNFNKPWNDPALSGFTSAVFTKVMEDQILTDRP